MQCQVCKATFTASNQSHLTDHAASRHPKNTYEQCFTV